MLPRFGNCVALIPWTYAAVLSATETTLFSKYISVPNFSEEEKNNGAVIC
jgi:hypothetical protein